MKKIISITLTISLILSTFSISVSAVEKQTETDEIERFTEELSEMINDYGNSDFITPSISVETDEVISEAAVDESDEENTTEDLDIKYLNRLIVQSNETINTYNALDVVSGFKNFYILQFANEQDTNSAYENYINDDNIISVSYDIAYNALASVTENDSSTGDESITYEDFANDWTLTATGMDMVLEQYKDSDLPEITVAVIDSGVNLDSVYLKDRIVRTNFNLSGEGAENSEHDNVRGHGTGVSSIVMKTTTDNVKIANYRVISSQGYLSCTSAISAIHQAIADGIKIINCSFKFTKKSTDNGSVDNDLVEETFQYAYDNECCIFFAAGNMVGNLGVINTTATQGSKHTIAVAMSKSNNVPSSLTAFGKPVDITAPGENVTTLTLDDTFSNQNGTSLSSPYMAGVCAMYVATHPQAAFEYVYKLMERCGSNLDTLFITDYFGSGIVNALKLFELDKVSTPTFNYENGNYVGTLNIEISAEEGATVYYTTDGTYPSPSNGTMYTKPVVCTEGNAMIRAVAYKDGYKSCFAYADYYVFIEGTDDLFTITADGIVTSYTGNIKYLKIPEVINGITVRDFARNVFSEASIKGIYLPDTVKYIGQTGTNYERPIKDTDSQYGPFGTNETLSYIVGYGIEIIGEESFANLAGLTSIVLPNSKEVYPLAFSHSSLMGANLPNVEKVAICGFKDAKYLREVYLPKCEVLGDAAFYGCGHLNILYAPNVKTIDVYIPIDEYYDFYCEETGLFNENLVLTTVNFENALSFGVDSFTESAIKKLELSNVKTILDLPLNASIYSSGTETPFYSEYYWNEPIELIFPSTLESCISAESYKREWNSYAVYGTSGTYAEQWAAENSIPFYEISQETAIREDIDSYWDKYSWQPLEFDARGFSRTYQWYGSYDNVIGNDKIISGATESSFNPNDYKAYPYYYCMMTSSDGDSVVNIHSSLCQNRLYYIYDTDGTSIDFDNLVIYTTRTCKQTVEDIVGIPETTTFYYRPSYIYQTHWFYGTGSQFELYNDDDTIDYYTIIVQGDVNGDSAVDVLDAMDVQRASTGKGELTGNYLTAADTDFDGEISVYDYAQVVNMALSS